MISTYQGERLSLPTIGLASSPKKMRCLTICGACSAKPGSLLPKTASPSLLQGLEKRGTHNRRKRIYFSAVTPDLYRPMYGDKVVAFFDKLLATSNAESR